MRTIQRAGANSNRDGVSPWALLVAALLLGSLFVFYGDQLLPPPGPVEPRNPEGIDAAILERITTYVERVEQDPRSGAAHGELGIVYEANNIWEEAIESYANAAKLDEDNALWDYHRAICMRGTGDAVGSLAVFKSVAVREPRLAAVHHRLGVAFAEAGRFDDATQSFELSISLYSKAPESFAAYANLENEREKHEHAKQLAQRALGIDPNYKSAHWALGTAYQGLGRSEDARLPMSKGQHAVPRHVGDPLSPMLVQHRIGYVSEFQAAMQMIERGQPEPAVPILEKLLKDRPQDTDVMNNLAAAYEALQRFPEAEKVLLDALAVDDQKFASHINLAGIYLGQERYPDALASIDHALDLAPDVGKAFLIKARICMGMNDLAAAYQAYKDTARTDPSLIEVHARMGELSITQHRYDDAGQHLTEAIRRAPGDTRSRVNLCDLLITQGRRPEATIALQGLVRIAPTHEEIARLQQLLGGG